MSKEDDEARGRKAMDERTAQRRSKEAEARPDAMHRAVNFLLHQAMMNNFDIAPEARHHLATLDREMADTLKLVEIEGSTAAETEPASEAQETQAAPKQSKRFSRTT